MFVIREHGHLDYVFALLTNLFQNKEFLLKSKLKIFKLQSLRYFKWKPKIHLDAMEFKFSQTIFSASANTTPS